MSYHICNTCKTGPLCDCGRYGTDSTYYFHPQGYNQPQLFPAEPDISAYIKRQTEDWLTLNTDGLDYIARLNKAIIESTEVGTWKEDTTSWKEWIATGRTLLRATLRKTKSRLYSLLWTVR